MNETANQNYSSTRPRVVIDVSEEQHQALKRLIPWGTQSELFRQLVTDLINVLEEHHGTALGMLLSGRLRFRDISTPLKELKEEESDGNNS